MKLCVYAICKNERHNIDRWLESVSEADEVAVLDTGSLDGTLDVLKKSGVIFDQKIFDPFRFDVARNESLKLVPEDCTICLPLDIDMFPIKGFSDAIKDLWQTDLGVLNFKSYFVNTQKEKFWFAHDRCAKWIYPVYEQILAAGSYKATTRRFINNEWKQKPSHASYVHLVNIGLEERPGDPYLMQARELIMKEVQCG